jgi:hypothetical protein
MRNHLGGLDSFLLLNAYFWASHILPTLFHFRNAFLRRLPRPLRRGFCFSLLDRVTSHAAHPPVGREDFPRNLTTLSPSATLGSVLGREISDEERRALRTIRQGAATTGEWPVFDFVLRELGLRGVNDPQRCLENIGSDLVRFEAPLLPASQIQLSAQGWDIAHPESTLIHDGFVTALRQCVERVRHDKPLSPSRPRELEVSAHDLWAPDSRADLRLLGLLLETENLGGVVWNRKDLASPFRIKLNPLRVREFGSVGSFADFVGINTGSPPLQAAA